MKAFMTVAAVAALLAGATIAQADDNPAKTPAQEKVQSGKVPAATNSGSNAATTGAGAMAPSSNTPAPGQPGSKPHTPDTKAK
jgi:uncharacterized membrane protein